MASRPPDSSNLLGGVWPRPTAGRRYVPDVPLVEVDANLQKRLGQNRAGPRVYSSALKDTPLANPYEFEAERHDSSIDGLLMALTMGERRHADADPYGLGLTSPGASEWRTNWSEKVVSQGASNNRHPTPHSLSAS